MDVTGLKEELSVCTGDTPRPPRTWKQGLRFQHSPGGSGTSHRCDVVSVTCPRVSSFLSCTGEVKVKQHQISLVCNFKGSLGLAPLITGDYCFYGCAFSAKSVLCQGEVGLDI